jgi:3',5'-cyclic AMP phosphodiesterase CpdA
VATTAAPAPVLQIVHISDLHFHVGPAPQNDRLVQWAIAALSRANPRLGQWLLDYWEDGRAGRALDSLVAFEFFLTGQAMPNEPPGTPPYTSGVSALRCATIPTWLVDTGDLSSAGDDASVRAQIAWVDRMANLMGAGKTIRLYGNHDAWPGKFPLIASKKEVGQHRTQFRNAHFAGSWPQYPPESIPLGASGNRVELYCLNSVIHDRYFNTRARGQFRLDPHWGGIGAKDQLPELRGLVAQRSKLPGRAFRILLSHHPIHYPPPAPPLTMSLRGATAVARTLINQAGSTGPLAHLVLSGHTHRLYPGHGVLPPNAGTPHHPPLGLHQMQLVVGSLSKATRGVPPQASPLHDVDTEPHQCQVLRLYEVPGFADSVEVRRAVIGRNNGTGRFRFMPLRAARGVWESTFLDF